MYYCVLNKERDGEGGGGGGGGRGGREGEGEREREREERDISLYNLPPAWSSSCVPVCDIIHAFFLQNTYGEHNMVLPCDRVKRIKNECDVDKDEDPAAELQEVTLPILTVTPPKKYLSASKDDPAPG